MLLSSSQLGTAVHYLRLSVPAPVSCAEQHIAAFGHQHCMPLCILKSSPLLHPQVSSQPVYVCVSSNLPLSSRHTRWLHIGLETADW